MTQTICAYAQFTKTLVGVNSLTVTWDVERITRSDGSRSALVTGGATGVTVGRRGLYGYVLTGADLTLYDYLFTAITAGDVDLKEVPALWTSYSIARDTELARLDDTITSRLAASGYTAPPSAAVIAVAVWAYTTRTLTSLSAIAADIWAYATRTLTQSAAAVTAAVTGSTLSIQRGDTFSATLTGLAANTGYVSIDWTVKRSKAGPDSEAILCVRKNASGVGDGLLILNGEAGTAALGSIAVNSATSLTITLAASVTDDLDPAGGLYYDIQYIFAASVQTASEGACSVTADVRRAIS